MHHKSTCQVCHIQIQEGRRLCATHRKHRAPTSARVARPDVARVLARNYPVASSSFYAKAGLVTTADLLALRGKSLLSASPQEFETASDLSDAWNKFLKAATE